MKNTSGIRPVEYRVLIRPDPIEQRSQGGILLPDDTHDREEMSQVKGTLIAYGDSAFSDFSQPERQALRPGARVYYAKYQGILTIGADNEEYRLMNDKDVGAIITEESAMPSSIMRGRTKGGLPVTGQR